MEINIKFYAIYINHPYDMMLNKYLKIYELKKLLKEKYKYNENFILTFYGKELEPNNRLCDYITGEDGGNNYMNIILESQLGPKEGKAYFVKIKVIIDSKEEYFYFQCFPKISTLKECINKIFHISENNQMILLNGRKILRDHVPNLSRSEYLSLKILSDYGIMNIKVKYNEYLWSLRIGRKLSCIDLIEIIKKDCNFAFDSNLDLKTDVNFFYEGKIVLNLGDILDGDTLDMEIILDDNDKYIERKEIPVFVEFGGKSYTIYVPDNCSIWYLKKKIYEKLDILPVLQRFENRKDMGDELLPISAFGIVKESTVFLSCKKRYY